MHKLQKRYRDARKIFYISTIVAMYLFELFPKANSQNNRSSGNRFAENQRITKY
jgi:hypothetical protein